MEMVEFLRLNEGIDVNVHQIVFATVLNMFSNVLFSKDVVGLDEELGCNKFDVQGLRKKHREMSMKMCALWETIVEERRKMGKDGLRDQDFLDTLIYKGFTDDQINKLFEELLQAGIDTTTSTINRTMIELLNNPESMTKLKKELVASSSTTVAFSPCLGNMPGRRICPGLPMAAKIVPLVVASLIYFHDWSLPEGMHMRHWKGYSHCS
ncbi:hypothetical protein BUALT_BualtUnG0056600 [Buddleja alternifolia]|uniref:Cytochrome P450 n=1 Tax=Buddleja alternifolia TaxID=168488 RepID=A0AAV6W2X4_9LAMI|nr:hypothetical protein BUALT_BualtUnG0056600 [Buddleja alternifolia]